PIDIFRHGGLIESAHRECRVAVLPSKTGTGNRRRRPGGGRFLYVAHEIGQAMNGFQAYEQMNMIGHASHSLRYRIETAHGASEIFVETGAPRGGDHGFAVFRCENEEVEEAGMC